MHPTTALPLVLAAAALAGCEQEEPIVSYTAPKDPPARRATAPRDPAEATAIEWTVPAGWRVQTGRRFMRYATLEAGTDAEFVEVAVTRLDGAGGPRLDNINRWREQVGMPPIDDAALDDLLEIIEVDGVNGFSVLLPGGEGSSKAMAVTVLYRGAEGTWFAKMMGSPAGVKHHTSDFTTFVQSWRFMMQTTEEPAPSAAGTIKWTKPPGWTRAPTPGPMRTALFVVGAASEKTTASISKLGGDGGGLLNNVNRWRRQLDLPDVERVEDARLQPVTIGDRRGQLFIATGAGPGAEQSRVAFVTHDGATWYIKLRGPRTVVENHAGGFDDFVASIRFE